MSISEIESLTFDELGRRHRRVADRRRCERRDAPLPRPCDERLLTLYYGIDRQELTCRQIADDLSRPENTVRSWINRAIHRHQANLTSREAFSIARRESASAQ